MDRNVAWWVFNFLSNYINTKYNVMHPIVQEHQDRWRAGSLRPIRRYGAMQYPPSLIGGIELSVSYLEYQRLA
jgi:hypothetical protein